jgi:hypothetical protein
MGNMHALFNIVQATRKSDSALEPHISGLHVLFDFVGAPRAVIRQAAADEMVCLLNATRRDEVALCRAMVVSADFPELERLGVTWAVMAKDQTETYVRFRTPLERADNTRMVEAAPIVLEKGDGTRSTPMGIPLRFGLQFSLRARSPASA